MLGEEDKNMGRNSDRKNNGSVLKRVIVSIIFLPCILIIARRGGVYFLAMVNIVILAALWEYYRMIELKGLHPFKIIGIVGGSLIPVFAYLDRGAGENVLLGLVFLGIMTAELFRRGEQKRIFHISVNMLGVLYVGWLGSHLVLLRELPVLKNLSYSLGFLFVLVVFILTWAYDTGAYSVGMIAGKHKLIPSISPGKTVEGAIGGLILAVVAILVARKYLLTFLGFWEAVFIAVIASFVGQLGDLVESMIKRDVNTKDSSETIPGHGGILDRFDSMLFNAPVIYYLLKYFILD